MKRYILVAIAGIAIAAYIVPTSGLLNFNAANASNGGSNCEGGTGNGGNGGNAVAVVDQSVTQVDDDGDGDPYGNTATVSNTGTANAVGGNGGNGGTGGGCGSEYNGGNGGFAVAVVDQSVSQTGDLNTATVTNTGHS